MTTKKSKQAIARVIILVLSIVILSLTLKTISIGFDLASISEQNSNTETWRISSQGSAAANNVYQSNIEFRNSIYNSPDKYTRFISTTGKFTQLAIGFTLLGLSILCLYFWYSYFAMRIRRFRRRLLQMRKNYIHASRKQLD